jgi:predicted DNA-binding protein (UPF0251 family)
MLAYELEISKNTVWKIIVEEKKKKKFANAFTAGIDCRTVGGPSCCMSRFN